MIKWENPTPSHIMQSALRVTTKVLSGNKVEVQLPPGSEGQEVDVFVVLPRLIRKPIPSRSLLSALQTLQTLEEPFPDVDATLLPLEDIVL